MKMGVICDRQGCGVQHEWTVSASVSDGRIKFTPEPAKYLRECGWILLNDKQFCSAKCAYGDSGSEQPR
jgi:hypothetical protein